MRLADKVAIVTGSAQGMGFETAKLFTREGARVAMVDINEEKLAESAVEVAKLGEPPMVCHLDITDSAAVAKTVKDIHANWGRIDILINNAAIQGPGGTYADATDELWDRFLDVNVKAAGYLIREVAPFMKDKGRGSIVNIGSISSFVVFPGQAVYAASKAAIMHMAKAVTVDLGQFGIRANCICPGPCLSGPMAHALREDGTVDPSMKAFADQHPMRRMALPEDIANAALFLASDESSHVAGVVLPVDGGFTCR